MSSTILQLVVAATLGICGDYDDIIDRLYKKYGEVVIATGLSNTGEMLFTVVNKDSGTWSMLFKAPNGRTCLVASGFDWREKKNPKPPRSGDVRS